MRKTKLIILPTRCLNRIGFLLLFLSCPVIGDWGRIKPDTEMSQWSILLDKEGSCGLIRNSRENELVLNGRKEYQEVDGGTPLHDTLPTMGNFQEAEENKPRANYEHQRKSERRIARREILVRKTVSFDRSNAFRHVENSKRSYRIPQEYRRRNNAGRLSMDRRVGHNNEVIRDNSRRRQKRESDGRRMGIKAESRRIGERRLSRRIENDDAITRRVSTEIRLSRVRIGNEESRNVPERRERRENGRIVYGDRRSSERDVLPSHRRDSTEKILSARRVERRRDTLNEQVSNGRRTARRSTIRGEQITPGIRRNVATSDTRKNERSFERRDALQKGEIRRFALDLPKKQDVRVGKFQEREFRKRTARIIRYKGQESCVLKPKVTEDEEFKWEFLGGIKNWFHQKTNRENWVVNNDFAATCLVGASVYLLTTLHTKTV